ncbi:phage tail sheath family protein [Thiococcus pfennigii]|uniref:phage tail sheath family protein n=2 Tax=Thiococcus pfennigii TaxID=1057 RepID=UPI001903E523|nr:phage tail sheath C-terminal domain-containing protein [Thiococcus pfennigii]MBK1732867.1 phage tail protein [Thiococcus pfennigii]
MPSALSYPGVYIEEVPSGVRTITGVATSITAFIGRARRGPVNTPVRIQGFAEFTRLFGGLWQPGTLGYAVNQFFQHGGGDALIVRVHNGAAAATGAADTLNLIAASPGLWGEALRVRVDHATRPEVGTEELFNLTIRDTGTGATESFRNVSVLAAHPRYIGRVLADESNLVRLSGVAPATRPAATPDAAAGVDPMTVTPGSIAFNGDGDDGSALTDAQITGDKAARTGLYALEAADLFNLLCIPPLAPDTDVANSTWALAAGYCRERRALLIVDPPAGWTANQATAIATAESGVNGLRSAVGNDNARNAAVYFPRLRMPDTLAENRLGEFAPCGAIAGIISRTDVRRGVWKAPSGLDAAFSGVQALTYTMTDAQNGVLNPLGLNCLRTFPVTGHVVWGARTLAGADQLASEWKYLPVRRLALYLEESLYRGTQWVVFEPNDEPLWSQIRLNVGAFMQGLFRQGAFQGRSPREAYFVRCDRETTTQNDINAGVVNILVGFAPLKPAEFVVIRVQQMAGQVEV